MSRENVEVVRAQYADFHPRTFEAKLTTASPDIEWHTTDAFVDAEVLRGRAAVLDFLHRFWGEFDEIAVSPEEFIDAGEQIVAVCRFRARGKTSGAETNMTLVHVWGFDAGEVVRVRTFRSRDDALEALGLQE